MTESLSQNTLRKPADGASANHADTIWYELTGLLSQTLSQQPPSLLLAGSESLVQEGAMMGDFHLTRNTAHCRYDPSMITRPRHMSRQVSTMKSKRTEANDPDRTDIR